MNSGSTYLGHLPAFVCTYPTPTVRGPGEPSIQPRTYRYVPIEAQSRLSLYSRMFIISISISSLRSIYPSQPHDFRTLFHTLPRSLSVPNSASKPVPLPCPALPCPAARPARPRAPHTGAALRLTWRVVRRRVSARLGLVRGYVIGGWVEVGRFGAGLCGRASVPYRGGERVAWSVGYRVNA